MGAVETARDALFGNPPSPTMEPSREGLLAAFTELQQNISGIVTGIPAYATAAALPAVTSADNGKQARVYADGTAANNTFWIVQGGAWAIDTSFAATLTGAVQPIVDDAVGAAGFSLLSDALTFAPKMATGETTTVRETDAADHAAVAGEVRLDGTAATAGDLIPNEGVYTKQASGVLWRTASSERQLAKAQADRAVAAVASIPFEVIPEEGGLAFAIYDLDDYLAGGWDFRGVFRPALFEAPDGSIEPSALTPETLARLLPAGFTGELFTFPTESGFGVVIEDLDNQVGFGQENDGNLYGSLAGGGGSTDPVLHAVTVWGDSMSDAGVPWLNPGEDWPSVLRSLGRTVNERAVAGQSAGQIIARQGGDPCLITLTGNQIPATTTPVAVTVKSELFVQNFGSQAAQTVTGIYCGVHASILRDAAGNTDNYTFQRTTAGTAIPAPAASPFVPDLGSAAQEDTQVIWVGRNGVASIMTTTIAKVDAAVRYLDHGRFLIVGVTTLFDGSEDAGSSNYNLIVSYNNYMAARYGNRFFDVRRYMIDQALADAGITPDSTDLADIAVDRIPTRFKESGAGIIHFNALANSLVGAKINAILNAKGY